MFYNTFNGNYSSSRGNGISFCLKNRTSLTWLIYINCGIFLASQILHAFFLLTGYGKIFYPTVLEWIGVPADLEYLVYRPWTLITYMFTQFEFLHLLFNMLWLYWFGTFFLNYFTSRQLTGVYIFGGLSGAFLYIFAYNIFPYFDQLTRLSSWAIGASASVMAIVFAVCTYLPQHRVYIFLIGPVKLIYLALFTALVDLLSIQYGNAGGHIAHLGGALFGWFFILGIKRNKDLSYGLSQFWNMIQKFFTPQKRMRVKYKKNISDMNDREYNEYKKSQEDQINHILDKISKSGYESLTREEKELLFKAKR